MTESPTPTAGTSAPPVVPPWETAAAPPPPPVAAPWDGVTAAPTPATRPGWTPGRLAALGIGAVVALVGLVLLGAGATVLWADRTHRDGGYLTSGSHQLTTDGSALVTVPTQLGGGGTGWLYAPAMMGTVRVRVQPTSAGPAMFVGIARTGDVDRYLAGTSRTVITEYFRGTVRDVSGSTTPAPPTAQPFWVAHATGTGPQTLTWKPTAGTWTVVVMNADGRPGIGAVTELGATAPALPWVGVGLLIAAAVFLAAGGLLAVGTYRGHRAS